MRRLLFRNAPLFAYISDNLRQLSDKPAPTSFYCRAFEANKQTAEAVANTSYLRSMQNGTLSPLNYGCLTVQDAYYCYNAQETMFDALNRIDRETEPDLFDLLESKVRAYDDYNRTFVEDWHIRNIESVIPTETIRLYSEHERRVALEEDPIYTLVAFLPCFGLWPWFARRLMLSPRYRPGVYREWFESVYQGDEESFGEVWVIGNFIEEWKSQGKAFDEDLAMDIYRTGMDFELKVFTEA